MLPRDIAKRSWRPTTGSFSLPCSRQRLTATFSSASAWLLPRQQQQLTLSAPCSPPAPIIIQEQVVPQPQPQQQQQQQQQQAETAKPFIEQLSMPTQLLEEGEQLDELSAGTGAPPQRGRPKKHKWLRRDTWFSRQLSLDMDRVRRGPPTASFPDGVPSARIRKFNHLSGYGGRVHSGGRKHKMYFSLKRGRK